MPDENAPPPVAERLARLELTLLESLTALSLLVRRIAAGTAADLDTPRRLEEELDRAWNSLFDPGGKAAALLREDGPAREVVADWADPEKLRIAGADALEEAMHDSGAAVGALYAHDGEELRLVSFAGYPQEVMSQFARVPLDSDLPAAAVAAGGRPMWFAQRAEIVETYPHLREAHERTEAEIGSGAGVQGAVVPLVAAGRVAAVVILGFSDGTPPAETPSLERARARIVRAIPTAAR